MYIAIINVPSNRKHSVNKDLAGGLGQSWSLKGSFFLSFLSKLVKSSIKLPVLSLAYVQAILKNKGFKTRYFEHIPNEHFDIFLVYGSMIEFKRENSFVKKLKEAHPRSLVGFIGPFPSRFPELFQADFIIQGEPEAFFLYQFNEKYKLDKLIKVSKLVEMDDLPTPDFTDFPVKSYSYAPALTKKPILTLQASRGCPYQCSYYCAYGSYQGSCYRKRSADKLFKDILVLKRKYKIKSVQFRDPTFGLDKKQVTDFCNLLIKNKIKINLGIETRLDILDAKIISLMHKVGLRNINIGIETYDEEIANKNKRKILDRRRQEKVLKVCYKLGIKVSGFYIFGYEGDTENSIKKTIEYSTKIKTTASRFAIFTPFPGTGFYEQLIKDNRILTKDFSKYTSFNLVFKHKSLNSKRLLRLLKLAYYKYYLRPSFIFDFLKWKIKGY
ncbi:MAG: radical SAM protein [Candidatus Pacearchaeota archaeon]|nr:radical SAM protein [Candidatus Pacearchaeota archaeon]